jgi:multiple sugar transport system substrate-binding protein
VNFKGGAVRLPIGEAGPYSVVLGSGYGVAANCENKDAALKVLGALAGAKAEQFIAEQGNFPAQKAEQPTFLASLKDEFQKTNLTAAFEAAFEGATAQRVTADWTEVSTAFPQELVSVYSGQSTMKEALESLQSRFGK